MTLQKHSMKSRPPFKRTAFLFIAVLLIILSVETITLFGGSDMKFEWNPNLFNYVVNGKTAAKRSVLASTIAGSWYPGNADELKKTIAGYLDKADNAVSGSTAGNDCNIFIVPHAGYVYSGFCAAHAYRHLRGRNIRRVILLAPSHRVYLNDQCAVPEADAVSTPLGEITVDDGMRKSLLKNDFVTASDNVHRQEHSTQIQYPFLQSVLNEGFTLLPVIAGRLSRKTAESLGSFLKRELSPDTVIVVSSDFTHFGRDFDYVPFETDRIANVRKVDLGAYNLIQANDAEGFHNYIEKNQCTICGAEAIRAMLTMKPDSHEATLFKYCTSADDGSGDRRFVCYLACGIKAGYEKAVSTVEDPLSVSDKKLLLEFVRRAIRTKFETGRSPSPAAYRAEATPAMQKKMGAFVTLHSADGNLRGCIGEIEPYRPLYEAVTARACDSAFRDPRFFPLRESEYDSIMVEISALTPSHPIDDWRKIEIGRHGMTVTKNGRSAVFLPQVAPEQGWTLEETLSHLCVKAGLKPDDFRSGATFTVFEAIVFSEKDFR